MTYWKVGGTWVALSPLVLVLVDFPMKAAGQCLASQGGVVTVEEQVVRRISFSRHRSGKKRSHSSDIDPWAAQGLLLCLDF